MQSSIPQAARPKPLKGTLWFGAVGAALIIIGVSAMLSANWHWVPLRAQIAVALTPLVAAWCGALWLWRRGGGGVVAEEVLGTVWSGGVICAVALLGRVLQLSSDSFVFCATVTALLLPVVWLLRSKAAWCVCLGFALATVCTVEGLGLSPWGEAAGMAGVLAVGTAALAFRTAAQWRVGGVDGVAWRWLIAFGATAWAIAAAFVLYACAEHVLGLSEASALGVVIAFLFAVGAFAACVERGRAPYDRPLSFLFAVGGAWVALICIAVAADHANLHGSAALLWCVCAATLVAAGVLAERRCLRDEGVFLFLAPVICASFAGGTGWVALGGTLAVGVAAIAHGVVTGRRMVANEGLLLAVGAAWVGFVAFEADLMLQGVTLLGGGVALLVLNLAFARGARKEADHD